ncbi:hypothetical protein B5M42_022320 [Paenibacillus athensensis]|uniref:Uncharacterized protein n=1 Tax=Paenibacillus athensensis TaxID=1967502 RepID=A0A4Y8PTS2_9BACL|nr:hypothetical protein [Paenibacillus athensensis]MCD1261542.1 hypothetical protein [Paenibacillus athensensis]
MALAARQSARAVAELQLPAENMQRSAASGPGSKAVLIVCLLIAAGRRQVEGRWEATGQQKEEEGDMERQEEWSGRLRPVIRRMRQARALRNGWWAVMAGLGAACLVLAAGRLWPIAGYRSAVWILPAVAIVAGLLPSALRRIPLQAAAALTDASGLEERLTTALRFRGDTSVFAELQRREAAERLEAWLAHGGLQAALPLQPPRRLWLSAATLAALLGLLLLLPNGQDAALARRQMDQAWIAEQQQVERLAAALAALPSPAPAVQRMAGDLSQLGKQLAPDTTGPEALDQLEAALQRLDQGLKDLDKQQLAAQAWADSWQRTALLRGIGEALARGDAAGVRRELGGVAEAVAGMTPQQQQLADELRRLAASAEAAAPGQTAAGLAGGLEQAAAALAGGDTGSAAAALQGLTAALGDAAAGRLALAEQRAVAGQQAAELAAGAGVQGGSGAGAQGGSGAGAQGGSGASAQGGSGAGAQGGSGADAPGGSGAGAGTGAGSRGLVSTPRERTAGGADPVLDSGPLGGGSGGTTSQAGSAAGVDGGSRPYEDVYADYAAEASSALNRSELPQNVQNLVRDYFLQIQPQR